MARCLLDLPRRLLQLVERTAQGGADLGFNRVALLLDGKPHGIGTALLQCGADTLQAPALRFQVLDRRRDLAALDANCKNKGRTTWTYNQSVLLTALAGMHTLTGDAAAVEEANKIAVAAGTHLTDTSGVLHDPCEPKCGEDRVQFKGILVRNLASLYNSAPSEPLGTQIETSANSVWQHARTEDNHFSVVWAGSPKDSGTGALISASDALTASLSLPQAPTPNSALLPRSTPEAQGISSQAILDFVEAANKNVNTFDSFMILRHGSVIAEGWWKPSSAGKPHILNSASKSFTSTAVGLAIQEHKLKLKDWVLPFSPNDAPPDPSANLKAMTVRDLLTMSGGHDCP